jgi:predicted hydrolase (HD superfamily)
VATLTRFELVVMLRIQLGDRALVRRSLAVEAAMEGLAPALGEPLEPWQLAGLGAGIDAAMCRHNPARLGEVAAERLHTEGAPAEVIDAVRARRRGELAAMSRLAAGLVVAEGLVAAAGRLLDAGDRIDQLPPRVIAKAIARAAQREDAEATRVLAAAERLGQPLDQLAAAAHAQWLIVREDLGW